MSGKVLYDWIDGGPECSWKCMVRGIEEAKACPDYNCFCDGKALAELHDNYIEVAKCLEEACDLEEELEEGDFQKLCIEYQYRPSGSSGARTTTSTASQTTASPEDATTPSLPTAVGPAPTFAISSKHGESDYDGNLSAGSIAGIAIGVLVAVGLLVAFLFCRSIRRLFDKDAASANRPEGSHVSELGGGPTLANMYSDKKADPCMPELDRSTTGVRREKPAGIYGGEPPQLSELDGRGTLGAAHFSGGINDEAAVTDMTGSKASIVLSGFESRSELADTQSQTGGHGSPEPAVRRRPVQAVRSPDPETVGAEANADERHADIDPARGDIPKPGSADESSWLAELEKEMEEKQKTLEEIRQAQEQRAALRERIRLLGAGEGSQA